MASLYHISFIFHGVPKMRDLEPAFSDAEDDWIRLSPFVWMLWSPKSPFVIYDRIKQLLDNEDNFFISKVELGGTIGFLQPWVWDWINRTNPGSVTTGDEIKRAPPPQS